MKLRAYLLMTFVVAVWGSTFVLIKGALADATPAAFNLIRMTLAFALLAIAYHRSWRTLRRTHIAAGALVGLCLAAGYQFQTIGLVRTTPSKSAFITGLVVVLVPLFSIVPALRPPGARAPRWNAFLGAALAFIGILFLTAPASAAATSSNFRRPPPGSLLHQHRRHPHLRLLHRIRLPLHRSRSRLAAHSLSAARHPSGWLLRVIHGHQPAASSSTLTSTSPRASSPP